MLIPTLKSLGEQARRRARALLLPPVMLPKHILVIPSLFFGTAFSSPAQETTSEVVNLDPYTVYGRAEALVGTAVTASQGEVGSTELATRPMLRRGEMLEVIPGLVVTQHSGGGKANQYFLRGFNLDHGTDFALSADGVPINMRTHAHGQGYADVNFIIPELVEGVSFNKGPFFAGVGDFSAAGATDVHFFTRLPRNFVALSAGEDDYRRLVAGITAAGGSGTVTVAGEASTNDGPFLLSGDFRRYNGFLRYRVETERSALTFTALGYDAKWNSTDQIPLRAVLEGSLSRFGTVDPTDGGTSSRYGVTFAGTWKETDSETRVDLYATRYRLDLFSNFTYFLDDPANGDQFEQADTRSIIGGSIVREWHGGTDTRAARTTLGLQVRSDFVDEVALNKTAARQYLSTVRNDRVREHSVGLFASYETQLTERIRAIAGARGDYFNFDVDSALAANSGTEDDFILSPKLSLMYRAGKNIELYASAGTGFHSNDARGTTIAIDPVTGEPAERVDPLVRSRGAELGLRLDAAKGFVSTVSLFTIEVDSELLFVGDAGSTEASGATRRVGVEFANFLQPKPWLGIDVDIAFTRGRFRDAGPEGDHIPGSIDTVVSAGVVLGRGEGFFGSLRARYFGPRDLNEDASVKGESSLLCNARLGYRHHNWEISIDVLNLFDRQDNDIEYFYDSRLPGELAEGVSDIHFHPVEPRTIRASLTMRF